MCGLLVVCFFAPSVSAAQYYPQKTFSLTQDSVSAYTTIELRGEEFSIFSNDSSASDGLYGTKMLALRFHVSCTLRNRSSSIKVADLNNFRIDCTNFSFPGTIYDWFFQNAYVSDSYNCDVYDISWNSNTTNIFNISWRCSESLVLEPDQQIDMQFDFYIPFVQTSADLDNTVSAFYSYFNSSTWTMNPLTTFQTYTVEQYANQYEGFWSYLVRSLQKLVNGNQQPYIDNAQQSSDVTTDSGSATTDLETVHQQEEQWYQDNSDAIAATGLSNFQFNANQSQALGVAVGQWSSVWSALGDWTLIYTFTLILSLATFILRHEPTTKLKQKVNEQVAWRSTVNKRSEAAHRARLAKDDAYYYAYNGYSRPRDNSGDLMQMAFRRKKK